MSQAKLFDAPRVGELFDLDPVGAPTVELDRPLAPKCPACAGRGSACTCARTNASALTLCTCGSTPTYDACRDFGCDPDCPLC